ncbi:MAG: mechanosensitive ion channel family protein [Clostridia bacterium]|nr:mechanosensitive ion channel family protein [Clostridia bacterium]
MKKTTNKSVVRRLIICAAALAILIPLGFITGILSSDNLANINFDATVIWRLGLMIFSVLAVETLIVFLLGLPNPENHRMRSVLSVVSSLMKYVAVIVILCWGLAIIGVNVSTIVASVGIVALVVGFSAESLISDVVTGAFMIFENQYNVGDIVEIDNFRGMVTSIGIRTTCITDVGDNVKIVNNSAMKNILNRSDKLSRSVSDIAVPYPTDLEKLEASIPALTQDIFSRHPEMMKSAPRYLGVQALAESSVVLRFVVDVDEKDIYSGARVLNHDLLLGFRKLGVECPYPQIDVHTDK